MKGARLLTFVSWAVQMVSRMMMQQISGPQAATSSHTLDPDNANPPNEAAAPHPQANTTCSARSASQVAGRLPCETSTGS